MIGDIDDRVYEELSKIRGLLEEQTGVQRQQNPAVDVDVESSGGGSGPLTETSPVFTTGEGGAEITSQSFTSEGRFAFGFPSRVVYLRTEGASIVVEFDSENRPTRRIPVPAEKGEITLGDGGGGFRAEEVNIKLARDATANSTTVHLIAYR
jgi:hypothetical protein